MPHLLPSIDAPARPQAFPGPRIITGPEQFNVENLYVDLSGIFGRTLHLKCEGFNFAGSVKLRAAVEMVEAAERSGELLPGSVLIESSSGNLGIALSMIAASRGYRFICVTDVRSNHASRRAMEAYGAQVEVIDGVHHPGGFLGARIAYVQDLVASDSRHVWLNQYANPNNWRAHHRLTGPGLAQHFPDLEVLFVGAGTTGTLMGCARYLREHRPSVKVVAIDAVGSVTFGGQPARRLIPGIGTGVRPPQLDASFVDDVVYVSEPDTIATCRALARRGFLFGGSTGTVVSGALSWLAEHHLDDSPQALALAPDLGERYLESIYDDDWVWDNFELRPEVSAPADRISAGQP
ncbi:2,3-diaminopropionate biosynthesis protein SbnA [Micromonospora sp. DT201]|uniref:2,3-diaminopropionate biosynthesis protein SbnA n=1 Tax=Micromonospora sp. DT201 TaxID=3393442 RepID=UPI003CF29840